MTEGRAAHFCNDALEFASKHEEVYEWMTFEDFKVAFRSEFSPVDEIQDALAALTSKDYVATSHLMIILIVFALWPARAA